MREGKKERGKSSSSMDLLRGNREGKMWSAPARRSLGVRRAHHFLEKKLLALQKAARGEEETRPNSSEGRGKRLPKRTIEGGIGVD